MIVLGIDPGTTRIGFGVIEKSSAGLKSLAYGLIPISKGIGPGYKEISDEIQKLVTLYNPDKVAVEKLFFFKNQKTIISVSEMRGVIMASLAISGVPISEYTPLQIKQAVSGYGRAGKNQVETMVRLILGIKEKIKPDDAADGLAIAICCANNIVY